MGSESNCQNVGKTGELCNGRKEIKTCNIILTLLLSEFFFELIIKFSRWNESVDDSGRPIGNLKLLSRTLLPYHEFQFSSNGLSTENCICRISIPHPHNPHLTLSLYENDRLPVQIVRIIFFSILGKQMKQVF